MLHSSRRGTSLLELLVALTLVELAAGAWLASALTTARLDRASRIRAATDLARHDSVAIRAAAPACRGAATPGSARVVLPASPGRPPLVVLLRCGR